MAHHNYGEVVDIPFPHINPEWELSEVAALVEEHLGKIASLQPAAVHIMGEFSFCFLMVNRLKSMGTPAIMSTTSRKVTEENGKKIVQFDFVRFRKYF